MVDFHISRRALLRKGILVCAFSPLWTSGLYRRICAQTPEKAKPGAASATGDFPDIVAIEGAPAASVKKALGLLGGMPRFVKPGFRVFLKPNLGFANPPEWATTTNPQVLLEVAKLALEAGAKTILIGDNPNRKPEQVLARCGIDDAFGEMKKVKVFLINKPRDFHKVPVPDGVEFTELSIASILSKIDLLINIPVAKSHQATGVSFGLKNMMGLIEDRRAFHTKHDLHRSIADMNRVIRPALTVLDATRILTTGGPTGPGKTVQKNLVVAGTDRVAVDSYGVSLERWNGRKLEPAQVSHILAAHEAGLGEMNIAELKVIRQTAGS